MVADPKLLTQVVAAYYKDKKNHYAKPTDRRLRKDISLDMNGIEASTGDMLFVELVPNKPFAPFYKGIVLENLGAAAGTEGISAITLSNYDIPQDFSEEALKQAEKAKPVPLKKPRVDLRHIPLVTIDGEDARDFDDAVYAETLEDGGFHLIVAIADVAYYVRPADALDTTAAERGNSVYLPDKVVPMLPEALSNGLCSLKPAEERGCLAVHLYIDKDGHKTHHEFVRGLMKSAHRYTYSDVQAIIDSGEKNTHITPLYAVYKALRRARDKRGALNIESDELKIQLGRGKKVTAIVPRLALQSHQLIEEMMVLANVSAAEELSKAAYPTLYRIHPEPEQERLFNLRTAIKPLGLSFNAGEKASPHTFNNLLKKAESAPFQRFLHHLILLTQSQARYHPSNIGHFGLGLKEYAHFTSPIRRYADLLVHRALITVLKLGEGGYDFTEAQEALFRTDLRALSDHLALTERRASSAERDCVNRFVATFYEEKVGEMVAIRIIRVFAHGMIVAFTDTLAEGYIPRELLGNDRYQFSPEFQCLQGMRTRQRFSAGDLLQAEIYRVDTLTGSVILRLDKKTTEFGGRASHRENRRKLKHGAAKRVLPPKKAKRRKERRIKDSKHRED